MRAVDISKTFVEIARRNAAAEGVDVRFQLGNAAALPLEDASVDFVVCRAAFKNFTEPLKALTEMRRVLRPGGKALLIDMRRDASMAEVKQYVDGLGVSRLNRWFMMFVFRHMLIKRAYPVEEFRRMAIEAGWATANRYLAHGVRGLDDEKRIRLNQLRLLHRALQFHGFAGNIGVFEAGPGIEEHNAIGWLQKASLQQPVVRCGCRCSFRGKKNPLVARPIQDGRKNLLIRLGQRNSAGIAQNLQHDRIAIRLGNAQTGGKRRRIFPHLAYAGALLEGPRDRRTSSRLHRDHARTFPRLDPAKLLQLFKRLPHPDQAHASAGRIKNSVGVFPAKLFHQLIAHGLLAFDAEGFFQAWKCQTSLPLSLRSATMRAQSEISPSTSVTLAP